ncbi:unnamed protein product [Cylicocyclus nassatus]|uniref:Uncharacterized protein n=1 Tax=Cylicocyclus nassatus TaxID=53992 RepID=A0AA36H725_CYLNA|nr:unnamed protein product [Cylicocyclus nassatus]
MHCAFSADLENSEEPNFQKKLIKDLGKKVINASLTSSAGLWTYGNVNQAKKFGDVFDDMVSNFSSFALKAEDLFCFGEERSPPGGENKEEKPGWKIDPIYDYNRIVIISLQGVNFTNNVDTERGVSLNVDLYHFNESDIQAVYDDIVRGFKSN